MATEADVIRWHERTNRLFELVDGTLLEKTMGTYESYLAAMLVRVIGNFADKHRLGIVLGVDGMLRLVPGLVRIPDVSFVSWGRFPGAAEFAAQAIADMVPDLAVEVISRNNTSEEMESKLHEYFRVGVQLVWYVYPDQRQVRVYSSPENHADFHEGNTVDGGEVLTGFSLELKRLFALPSKATNRD